MPSICEPNSLSCRHPDCRKQSVLLLSKRQRGNNLQWQRGAAGIHDMHVLVSCSFAWGIVHTLEQIAPPPQPCKL